MIFEINYFLRYLCYPNTLEKITSIAMKILIKYSIRTSYDIHAQQLMLQMDQFLTKLVLTEL